MPRHPMTVEDLWALPRVGSPVPSSDGAFCIVPVTTYSMETNEGTCRLWLVPANGDPARALTTAEVSSGQPSLSPDGTRIAFTRKPGGPPGRKTAAGKAAKGALYPEVPQLYVMPVGGGEPERLTDLPLGVADPRWFPVGNRIACLVTLVKGALTPEATADLIKSRDEDPVKASVTEDRVYRYWDHWLTDGKVHHLFAIDAGTRAAIDLTPDSERWFPLDEPANNYRIAPDGREVAFTAIRSQPPHDPLVYGVFTASVPDRIDPAASGAGAAPAATSAKLLTADHPAHAYHPVYSPDGRFLAYGIQREIDFYGDRGRVTLFDRASGRHTVVTEAWDLSAGGWAFSEDSRTLVVEAEVQGRTALFALDVEAALRAPASYAPKEMVRGGTFTEPAMGGGRIFTTLQSLSEPPEAVTFAADGTDLRRLTHFTAATLETIAMGRVEETTFAGAGGRPIQMFVVHPGSDAAGPRPLVQMVHGGPHAAFGDTWHWRWNAHAFAARGFVIALVNFHGSTGWGQEFTASILGRWGDQPYDDVMAATDHLIDKGLVDPKRMAAAGGSYGGYLVSWIAAKTDRFACIVNHAGVCDFQTQFGSDVTQGRRRALGGAPWEGIEAMDRYNPIRSASGFKTPMLVVHGEKDYRVPYGQALEIYNILKGKKVPARLVVYPDENHWILKPRNSRHWYGEVLGWLDRWLG